MLDTFRPKRLSGLAQALHVDPFEVVRLSVAAGVSLEDHAFSGDDLTTLETFAGIEHWFTVGPFVADASPVRSYARSGVKALLDGGFVGSNTTRLDNLWRGVPAELRPQLEQAIGSMLQAGELTSVASPKGTQVAAVESARDALAAFASDGTLPASLTGVL
jgi:hypothetical protein